MDLDLSGTYDAQTTNAVRSFQQLKDLRVTGAVDPPTWARLLVSQERGDQGEAIEALQTLLKMQGHDYVVVDGDFGDQTKGAIENLQAEADIDVTGECNSSTWIALFFKP